MNVNILASTSVPFTLTTVQVPNLALTHTKRITVLMAPADNVYRRQQWSVYTVYCRCWCPPETGQLCSVRTLGLYARPPPPPVHGWRAHSGHLSGGPLSRVWTLAECRRVCLRAPSLSQLMLQPLHVSYCTQLYVCVSTTEISEIGGGTTPPPSPPSRRGWNNWVIGPFPKYLPWDVASAAETVNSKVSHLWAGGESGRVKL